MECRREDLAEGPVCKLQWCDCGVVHVTVGPLTFRLDAGALSSLAETVTAAAQALERRSARGRLRLVDGGPGRAS